MERESIASLGPMAHPYAMTAPPSLPPSSEDWPWISEIELCLRDRDKEHVVIAYLDRRDGMLDMRVEQGAQSALELPLRDILRDVLDKEPAAVVLAHNHPSGSPLPSAEDKRATQMLCAVLRPIGVRVADHLIFAGDKRVSLRDLGLL
jgi:DNA repair protein RadC